MKDYRNFILIENDKSVIIATYANCSSEVSYKKFAKEYLPTKISNNNIDSLKIINKHMAQILKWKNEDTALSLYYLLIPPKLCKIIKDKIYRQWIGESDKRFNIKEEEIKQWKIFDMLYKSIFADISFKPNNVYNSKNVNKAYRHIIYTKEVINKIYIYLEKDEEATAIKSIDDLVKYRYNY